MSDQPTSAGPNQPQRNAVPVTGLDAVDRVLTKDSAVSELPLNERAAAYQELHTELEAVLHQRPGSLPTGLTGQ